MQCLAGKECQELNGWTLHSLLTNGELWDLIHSITTDTCSEVSSMYIHTYILHYVLNIHNNYISSMYTYIHTYIHRLAPVTTRFRGHCICTSAP